jgi:ubiquitin C-terminal hydrolase
VQKLYGGGPPIAKDSTFPVYLLTVKKVPLKPVGMENPLLNLCFITAVMQMLFSIEQLNGYILKKYK